jgi:hypothetical protein
VHHKKRHFFLFNVKKKRCEKTFLQASLEIRGMLDGRRSGALSSTCIALAAHVVPRGVVRDGDRWVRPSFGDGRPSGGHKESRCLHFFFFFVDALFSKK